MKIAYLLLTTEQDEFYAVECFRQAYARYNGAVFTGTMTVFENVSAAAINQAYIQDLIDDGYEMILRNTSSNQTNLDAYEYGLTQGLLAVIPAGSNNYHDYISLADKNNVGVFCGSGVRGTGNATGYPCLFYDGADLEQLHPIVSITQVGSEAEITISGGDFVTTGYGITLSGITGFSNNPNGIFGISANPTPYFVFRIVHTLGSGSYAGGGTAIVKTQSYSTPTIGGLLAFMKDSTREDWSKIISRAIQSASLYPSFDTYSGYGFIDVSNTLGVINTTTLKAPELTLTQINTTTYDLDWSIVPNALEYEVYYRNVLVATYPAHITKHRFTLTKQLKGNPNLAYVRAINGDNYEDSLTVEMPYYNYKHIGKIGQSLTVKEYD